MILATVSQCHNSIRAVIAKCGINIQHIAQVRSVCVISVIENYVRAHAHTRNMAGGMGAHCGSRGRNDLITHGGRGHAFASGVVALHGSNAQQWDPMPFKIRELDIEESAKWIMEHHVILMYTPRWYDACDR